QLELLPNGEVIGIVNSQNGGCGRSGRTSAGSAGRDLRIDKIARRIDQMAADVKDARRSRKLGNGVERGIRNPPCHGCEGAIVAEAYYARAGRWARSIERA